MKSSDDRAHVSSFFLRVLVALLIVNLGSAAVLIYIAYTFNTASLSKHVKETISQQVTSFGNDLINDRILSIKKTLQALESSQDMDDYMDSSKAKQLILSRRIEKLFIQIQKDNTDITGLYFFDDLGKVQIAVEDRHRIFISYLQKKNNEHFYVKDAAAIFKELSENPLLLSSGNMEWFMPPREVLLAGPFQRSDGDILLAGLAKLDISSGIFGGMLLLRYNLNNWLNNLAKIHVHNSSPVWVFDQTGNILLQPPPNEGDGTFNFKSLPAEKRLDTELIESRNGIIAYRDIIISEPDKYLRLAFVVPGKLLSQDFDSTIEFFTGVLVISVVLVIFFSYFISNFLVLPFKELAVARNKLVTAQRLAGLGHWEWEHQEKCFRLSDNALNILNHDTDNNCMVLKTFLQKVHLEDRDDLKDIINSAIENNQPGSIEYKLILESGVIKFIHLEIDVIIEEQPRIIGTVQDVSERRHSEERIRQLAYRDAVTGLANRSMINELAENALQAARLKKHKLAIIFLDLDKFKHVNDSMGHEAGDILLRKVARRLLDCVRPSDLVSIFNGLDEEESVGRIGGDEFIIILPNLADSEAALEVASRIQHCMKLPFTVNNKQLLSGGSMGISLYPEHGKTVETLLRNADAAMYMAKQRGRNRYELYNPEIDAIHMEKVSLENALQRALNNDEFKLFYQPRYNMASGKIVSFEALVRWIRPEKGIVMPDEFIYIAEENGQINAIGLWVLETALKQLQEWQKNFDTGLGMSVNLSPVQFMSGDLVTNINPIIRKYNISPNSMELELTENALFNDVTTGVKIAYNLKKLGIGLSIDDFGTGYSSLQLLRQFPVDTLKIDQSFVQDILTDHEDRLIVESSIILGHNLGLKIVAEGVSEEGHWKKLLELGCDEAQGFYLSKPHIAEHFEDILLNNKYKETTLTD